VVEETAYVYSLYARAATKPIKRMLLTRDTKLGAMSGRSVEAKRVLGKAVVELAMKET
jgi:hypothetical protein